ncbi:hypothetical protein GCM10027431_29610 [Lysobacter rhizosphaerae]
MDSTGYISDQWADYRRRVRWFFCVLGAIPPVVGLFLVAPDAPLARAAIFLLAAVWVVAFFVVSLRLQFFPCPACGKPFAYRYVNNLPLFTGECIHCGLPKWQH